MAWEAVRRFLEKYWTGVFLVSAIICGIAFPGVFVNSALYSNTLLAKWIREHPNAIKNAWTQQCFDWFLIFFSWFATMVGLSIIPILVKKWEDIEKKSHGKRKLMFGGYFFVVRYSTSVLFPVFSTIVCGYFNVWQSLWVCGLVMASVGCVLCALKNEDDFGLTDSWVAVVLNLIYAKKGKYYGTMIGVSGGCNFRKLIIFIYKHFIEKEKVVPQDGGDEPREMTN